MIIFTMYNGALEKNLFDYSQCRGWELRVNCETLNFKARKTYKIQSLLIGLNESRMSSK